MKEKHIIIFIYILLFFMNLKFVFTPLQIPYSLFFTDFKDNNSFVRKSRLIKENNEVLKNRKYVGFVSNVKAEKVLMRPASVEDFYCVQYGIVPAILVNDIDEKYAVGVFHQDTVLDPVLKVYKQINRNVYILKRRSKK